MPDDQRERVAPPAGGAVLPCGCGCTCGGAARGAGDSDAAVAVSQQTARSSAGPQRAGDSPAARDEAAIGRTETGESVSDESATGESVTDQPATDESVTDQPATGESGTDQPATDQSLTDQPVTDAAARAAVVAEHLDPAQPALFRLQSALDETPTGVPLVRLLSALDLPSLSAFDLTEVAAAYVRVAGWAHAGLARAAAALHRAPDMPHPRLTDHQNRAEQLTMPLRATAMPLSLRLHRSPQEMLALVREGLAYDHHLSATGQALADGRLAVPAARAIAAVLGEQPWQIAQAVEDRVLPRAADRTTGQVRRDVARALLEVDPEHAADRHAEAQASRMVTHPRALPDQMAEMRLVLPAPRAVAIDTVLESCARTARAAGDPRTLDQLRADGLTDLLLASPSDAPGAQAGGATASGTRADTATADTTASGTTTVGTTAAGATTVDTTAAGATTVDTTAADTAPVDTTAADTTTVDTAASGTIARGATAGSAAPGAPAGPAPDVTTPAPAPRARGRIGTGPRDARTHVVVTVPLSTLLGQDEQPADLAGYGAIDATTARALALGGTWQRLVADDLTGAVLDVGRSTYRPPAALAAHVRHRDATCVGPGCSVPAALCDLDHTEPWHPEPAARDGDPDPPGTTSDHNLGPVCPRHHRAKHQLGLTLRQREPGVFDWTDPTGHAYRTRPGLDAPTEHLTAPRRVREAYRRRDRTRSGGDASPGTGQPDEPPPF
jgi:hypothetical protein